MFLKFSSNFRLHNCTLEPIFWNFFYFSTPQQLSALLIELFNQMNPKECTSMNLEFFLKMHCENKIPAKE